jgi:hypothetical protein
MGMLEKSAVTRLASFVGIFVTTLGVAIGAGASGASAEESAGTLPNGLATNPCALVTKAEAETAVGEPLDEPSATHGTCMYRRKANGLPLFSLQLYPDKTKSAFESDAKTTAKILNAKVPARPAAGYGEAAFTIGDSMLTIFKHGKSIWVMRMFPKDPAPAKLEAFVRKVLTRL